MCLELGSKPAAHEQEKESIYQLEKDPVLGDFACLYQSSSLKDLPGHL